MVEARAAEMTVEEAEEINAKPTDSSNENYDEEQVEEAIDTSSEEDKASESTEEPPVDDVPAEETQPEEAPAEEAPAPAPAPTWGDDEDPWADN